MVDGTWLIFICQKYQPCLINHYTSNITLNFIMSTIYNQFTSSNINFTFIHPKISSMHFKKFHISQSSTYMITMKSRDTFTKNFHFRTKMTKNEQMCFVLLLCASEKLNETLTLFHGKGHTFPDFVRTLHLSKLAVLNLPYMDVNE